MNHFAISPSARCLFSKQMKIAIFDVMRTRRRQQARHAMRSFLSLSSFYFPARFLHFLTTSFCVFYLEPFSNFNKLIWARLMTGINCTKYDAGCDYGKMKNARDSIISLVSRQIICIGDLIWRLSGWHIRGNVLEPIRFRLLLTRPRSIFQRGSRNWRREASWALQSCSISITSRHQFPQLSQQLERIDTDSHGAAQCIGEKTPKRASFVT